MREPLRAWFLVCTTQEWYLPPIPFHRGRGGVAGVAQKARGGPRRLVERAGGELCVILLPRFPSAQYPERDLPPHNDLASRPGGQRLAK